MMSKSFFVVCLTYYFSVSYITCSGVINTVNTDVAGTMNYQVTGNGNEVLVLIDGTLGDIKANNFKSIYDSFDHNKYKFIQIDLPGFGGSRTLNPDGTLSERTYPGANFFERDADAIIQTMAAIGVERYSVLGYGFGGTVALFVASRAPQNVLKCVEWNAKPFITQQYVNEQRQKQKPVNDWDPSTKARQDISHTDEYKQKVYSDLIEAWQRMADDGNSSTIENLKNLKVPTLLMHSTDNEFSKLDQVENIRRDAPSCAKIVLLDTKKHNLQKLPVFKVLVEEFLGENYSRGDYCQLTAQEM